MERQNIQIYREQLLNAEEKEALKEVIKMGFPPKAWYAYKTMGIHAFTAIYPGLGYVDKKYFDNFWKVPGYLAIYANN